MADTTASLGIQVTGTGIKETTADLDKLNQSAKLTTDSAGRLHDSLGRFVGDAGGAATAAAGLAGAHTTLGGATTASGQSLSLFQRVLSGISGLFGPYSSGAAGASSSMSRLAGAHGEVAQSVRILNPLIAATGSTVQGLGSYAVLARTGLTGLALGLTGAFLIALESSADKVTNVKDRLQALLGQGAGQNAFDQLKNSTDKANNSLGSYLSGIEAVQRALATQNSSVNTQAQAPGFTIHDVPVGPTDPTVAATAMSQALQIDKMSATDAAKAVDGYLNSIAKYGGMTEQLYQQIEKDSPTLSAAISKALGGDGSLEDQAKLEASFKNIQMNVLQTLNILNQTAPQMQAAYTKMTPNVTQGVDQLKASFVELFSAMGTAANVTGTTGFLNDLTSSIKRINTDVQNGTGIWTAFWKELNSGGPVMDKFQSDISKTMDSAFTPPQGWQTMFSQIGDLILHALHLDGVRDAIKTFLDDADAMVASWASTIANSIASAFQSAVQKINAAAALLIKLTPSSPGNYGTNTTGQPSFDATGVNLSDTANLSDTSNLMNFAQGGLTQVTGPSGTDKTLVSFMATNGEIVAVGNPSAANAASGGSSGAAVSAITSPITAAIDASTGQIVSAISTSSINVAASTAAATAAASGPTGFNLTIPKGSMYGMPAGSSTYASQYAPLPYDPTPTPFTGDTILSPSQATSELYQPATSNYSNFADGFDGYVGGSGAPDSKRVTFNATPGELVSVTPPNKAKGANTNVTQHFYLSQAPGNTYMSASQMKRMMQMSSR